MYRQELTQFQVRPSGCVRPTEKMPSLFGGRASQHIVMRTLQTKTSLQPVHPAVGEWRKLAAVSRMQIFGSRRGIERELEETNPPQPPQPPQQQFGGVGIEAIRQLRDKRRLKNKKTNTAIFRTTKFLENIPLSLKKEETPYHFYIKNCFTLNKKGGGGFLHHKYFVFQYI